MTLRNAVKVNKETIPFQLFFLKDEKKSLEKGQLIFIRRERLQELKTSLVAGKDVSEPWYFSHF